MHLTGDKEATRSGTLAFKQDDRPSAIEMRMHRRHQSEQVNAVRLGGGASASNFTPPTTPAAEAGGQLVNGATPFTSIVQELEMKKRKIYYEGALERREDLDAQGAPLGSLDFVRFFAKLEGTSLLLWPAETSSESCSNPSSFLNLSNARMLLAADHLSIIISTIGRNRITFRPASGSASECDKWYLAFRVATFECARLQEIYTAHLVRNYRKDATDLTRKDTQLDGLVDVRVTSAASVQSQWTRMYCSLHTPQKLGHFKRLSQSMPGRTEPTTVSDDAIEFRLFDNKKDKQPRFVLTKATAAYALYPESQALIETASILKIDGLVAVVHDGRRGNQIDGSILLLPLKDNQQKRLSYGLGTSSESPLQGLLKMAYALWSAFGLYGKPEVLHLDVDHVNALGRLNLAVDLDVERLIESKDMNLHMPEAQWRSLLRNQTVLSSHYRDLQISAQSPPSQVVPYGKPALVSQHIRTGKERRVASEGAIYHPPQPLVTTIEEDAVAERLQRIKASAQPSYTQLAANSVGQHSLQGEAERVLPVPARNGGRERYSPRVMQSTENWPSPASSSVTEKSTVLRSSANVSSTSGGSTIWSNGSTVHLNNETMQRSIRATDVSSSEPGSPSLHILKSPAMLEARYGLSQQFETRNEHRRSSFISSGTGSRSQLDLTASREEPARYIVSGMEDPARYSLEAVDQAAKNPVNLETSLNSVLDSNALGLIRRPTNLSRETSFGAAPSVRSQATDGETSIYSEVPTNDILEVDADSDGMSSGYASTIGNAGAQNPATLEKVRAEAMRQLSIRRPLYSPPR